MLKKLSRYYHTIKYLKPIQIRYQLWYRLRNKLFPVKYPSNIQSPSFQKVKLSPFPPQHVHYKGNNHFEFLNFEHHFPQEINWNYSGHGKLWTYHLNYFDYLHQPDMEWSTGLDLINDFLQNPGARTEGLEPYPISLRTINWIKFLAIHQEFPEHIVKELYAHYKILSKKIEYHLLANHLLENAFSLLFGAVFFQDKKLIRTTRKILKAELKEQILKDGGHFELSPMYHIILLQRALDCYNLLINNDHHLQDIEQLLKEKIQKMVNWLYTVMFSNGDIPLFGDSVEGQAIEAKVVLEYASKMGFESDVVRLSDSGYRKRVRENFEMVMDVGNIMPTYQPGHSHADALSFVLYHQGKPIIIDRGISTYETGEFRNEERGTASHNTVVINNKNQSDMWGGFRVGRRAQVQIVKDNENILEASCWGYGNTNAMHSRTWHFKKGVIIIKDSVRNLSDKSVAYFHFHPLCEIKTSRDYLQIDGLMIQFDGANTIQTESYAWCQGFNDRVKSKRIKVEFEGFLKTTIHNENTFSVR